MKSAQRAIVVLLLTAGAADAQDWPQWRGPNRDNKVVGFLAPAAWPKELTKKWKVTVGQGDSSPVLVGDRVYVFGRQGENEVTQCLDAATGKEIWKDQHPVQPATGGAGGIHAGPRGTPAVAEGKVCTLGVRGTLTCVDAASGKVVWREESKAWPMFFTAASPIIVEGKCIAYLGGGTGGGKGFKGGGGKGGEGKGTIVAYDLERGPGSGWKWDGDSPGYGSPVLMTAGDVKQIVAPTARSLVGIGLADGKLLWQAAFQSKYNSGTPIVEGDTVIASGPGAGTAAFKIEKDGAGFAAKPLWKKKEAADRYNTPVLKDGYLYGLVSAGRGATNLFCMNAQTGDVVWTDKESRGECGTIFDAGKVLLALTSDTELIVLAPNPKSYTEVARYKVADTAPWAYPIVAGNRVFVKDQNSLTLWVIE